ncbi:P-loop containing nucleoside triphosphate hydrolase [Sesbania bispinosa]|nr:P-loop containing nucleoside triphosphate hydrolase [Sesbania bispinosa]
MQLKYLIWYNGLHTSYLSSVPSKSWLFCHFPKYPRYYQLSEPLLAQKIETKQTQLGHATLLSKLTFSWVNSLLSKGYSKPLALEDIPTLLSEDEAHLAYQNFLHEWESLVRERSKNNTKNLVLWAVLKLSSSARRRHSTGEIVNYIAVDAYRMGEFPWWFHVTWTSALQLVLSISLLFYVVGFGALPGLVPLLICGLLNIPFAKILQNCHSQFMIAQDVRLRSTSEILNSMKIIKLQSWEEKFKNLVLSLRAEEFIWLSKAQVMKAYMSCIYWMSPTIVPSVIFLGCALFNSAPLNAETIFTVIATLKMVAEPVRRIPEALSIMIQVKVSFDRLNTFLLDEELTSDDNGRSIKQCSVNAVEIHAGNFIWDHESVSPTLTNVNLEIKWGQKIAVCGQLELGNHLFCQRGINMSGGQKQRIQLARAVYNNADIYLLDDPFSAVDAHTAAILFNDCVMRALKDKTVILVTHQVEFLSEVDTVLVMEGGKVTQSGNYEDLLTAGTTFEQLVRAHREVLTELDQNNESSEIEIMAHLEESHGFYVTKNQNEGEISTKGQLTQEEEKEIGFFRFEYSGP